MVVSVQLLTALVLAHAATFVAGRRWSATGSSRMAHGVAAGLLLLLPALSFFSPAPGPGDHPWPSGDDLKAVWLGRLLVAGLVLLLAQAAADRGPQPGAPRREVLGWGTFLCSVGLLVPAATAELLGAGSSSPYGPPPLGARSFEGSFYGSLLLAGTYLGLACSYAGFHEVRSERTAPAWGPLSALFFLAVAIFSMVLGFHALEGLLA